MSDRKPLSSAQFVDRFMTRTATGVLLVSLAYAATTVEYFAPETLAFYLDKLALILGLLAVVIVFPQFVQLIRRRTKLGIGKNEPEGFVIEVYKRAAERAFSLTFIFLLFMDVMTDRGLAGLPAEVVVETIIAFSLAIFSLSFFIFNRAFDGEDDDFDEEVG